MPTTPPPTMVQRINELVTSISAEVKSIRTLLNGNNPDLSYLTTTNKTHLVAAINELKSLNAAVIDDTTASSSKTYSSVKIAALISNALSALTNGAPEALNQLNELANALGNDANYAATVAMALSNRVRVDIANQGLTDVQKSNARTNIGADITTNEIGNPNTDFVSTFRNGLV